MKLNNNLTFAIKTRPKRSVEVYTLSLVRKRITLFGKQILKH